MFFEATTHFRNLGVRFFFFSDKSELNRQNIKCYCIIKCNSQSGSNMQMQILQYQFTSLLRGAFLISIFIKYVFHIHKNVGTVTLCVFSVMLLVYLWIFILKSLPY